MGCSVNTALKGAWFKWRAKSCTHLMVDGWDVNAGVVCTPQGMEVERKGKPGGQG